jgi:hypothetical protein
MTESWKAEGRVSEAWAVADPEIVEIFSAGIAFGMEVDGVVAATLQTLRTNGAKHCGRQWRKQRPLKTNLKKLKRLWKKE